MFINQTQFLGLAVIVLIAMYVVNLLIEGGVLNQIVKWFKGKTTFKKALLISLAVDLISILGLPLGLFSNNELIGSILITVFSIIVFVLLANKYFELSYGKAILAMIVNGVLVTIISLALIIVIRQFVTEPFYVNGGHMEPTVTQRDYLLVNKFSNKYERGDIIVYRSSREQGGFIIQRIIGLPGEEIKVSGQKVLVNGNELNESYIQGESKVEGQLEVDLAEYEYFTMGDNRAVYSRGKPVESAIIGRIWARAFPFEKAGFFKNQ